MFEALCAIGRAADVSQQKNSTAHSSTASVDVGSEGMEEWLAQQLRRAHRRQAAAGNEVEEATGESSRADAPHTDAPCGGVPRRVSARLAGDYAAPLAALHVAAGATTGSTDVVHPINTESAALQLLSGALPTAVVWGMAARVWHHAEGANCPTLHRTAAELLQQDPTRMQVNAQLARQQLPSALRGGASENLACVMDAIQRVAAVASTAEAPQTRKRQRGAAVVEEEQVEEKGLYSPPRAAETSSTWSTSVVGASPAAPLSSTAARAQRAVSSRSRSRSPTPPPPPPPRPETTSSAPPVTSVAAAHTTHSAGKAVPASTSSPSFAFSVRLAGATINNNNNSDGTTAAKSTPWQPSTASLTSAAALNTMDDAKHPNPASLRQTTLAAFTADGGGGGKEHASPPPQPQPLQPQSALMSAPEPTTTATPGTAAAAAAAQSPSALKRASWYNPPSSSSKAPPYQYDLRRGGGGDMNEGVAEGLPSIRAGVAASPPVVSHTANNTVNNSGGFVTAGEQLATDVKQGRAMSSAYLSKRSPALGLRRTGFQPPFRDQQQPLQQPPLHGVQPGAGGEGSSPLTSRAEIGRPARATANNADDESEGSYPASLLLPDGSVPPILQPLDPKLVTQVAMEIMDSGAGAKQVGWDDIAGLQHAKASVEEAIVWPLRRPDLFVGLRDPPRGLLLFGPPGTGKTMIARAIANRAGCTFLNISSSSLMSKWMGDGEKLVRCLFAVATVRQPSVIFIDEIDSLLSMRGEGEMDSVRRVKTEFLVQLDGVATDRGDRVLLIGATNRPDDLDEAARRRMEKRLYIPLPDDAARMELIQRLLRSLVTAPCSSGTGGEADAVNTDKVSGTNGEGRAAAPSVVHTLTQLDLESLVRQTQGYSGADLKQLCREAAMGPLREMSAGQLSAVAVADLRPIQRRDFKQALRRLKPSVGPAEVERYVQWNCLFGSFNEQDSESESDEDGGVGGGVKSNESSDACDS